MEKFFSVLISVYHKENPLFLQKCLTSMVRQSVLPFKIIVVKDGQLTPALAEVLESFQQTHPELFYITGYETNLGLGKALQFGLQFVETPWVARMDSDDIAVPIRFQQQIEFLKSHSEIDVLGCYLAEFESDENKTTRIKKVPVTHEEIYNVAHLFNPMNHMTVFMKTQSVLEAGGYKHAPFFEDYDLWIRMLAMGMKFHNLPLSLVLGRVGNDMVGKRHGLQYLRYEYQQFQRMRALEFLTGFQYYKALTLRLPLRLLPKKILAALYNLALRRKSTDD